MALVFVDSFDPYENLLLKWSSGVTNFNASPQFVRTGLQSLNPNASVTFAAVPRINFARRTGMTCGFALYPVSFGAAGLQISYWYNTTLGANYGELRVANNGALLLYSNNSQFANSAPGAIIAGQFNYIEVSGNFVNGGTIEVRVNGVTVINFSPMEFGVFEGVDSFLLPGNTTVQMYYDDLYLLDDTGGVNNTFLGAVQIFAILPDANETPLQWTPLSGQNFANVDTAPPPGDASYVASNTPGQIDQYHYTITGPSGSYGIKGIQHSLCARIDSAGSHTVASQINTHTSGNPQVGSNAPGADYDYAIFPWDLNPNTAAPFQPADFATTFVGPNLTS